MPLSESDRAELERLGVDNVRQRLVPGSGGGSVVPGLGPGFGMTRGDVEEWLAEKSQEATKLQRDILWWAKAATWIGVTNILVMIALTALSFIWPID
jgi:hypothetical protein